MAATSTELTSGDASTTTSDIQVTVAPVNDRPEAGDDAVGSRGGALTATEDTVLKIAQHVLLGNDYDVDGDVLQVVAVSDAEHGTIAIDGDGTISFTPDENYSGPASFKYTISDGQGETATATVDLHVDARADTPQLSVDSVSGMIGDTVELPIAAALTDTDGSESLEIRIANLPSGAELNRGIVNADGVWLLTPADLVGLELTLPVTSSADFALEITAIATDENGHQSQSTQRLDVDVSIPPVVPEPGAGSEAADDGADRTAAAADRSLEEASDLVEQALEVEPQLADASDASRLRQVDELIVLRPLPPTDWSHTDFDELQEVDVSAEVDDDSWLWSGQVKRAESAEFDQYQDGERDSLRGAGTNRLAWLWGLVRAYGGSRGESSGGGGKDEDETGFATRARGR